MRNFIQFLTALSLALAPLVPALAHAEENSVSGSARVEVSLGTSADATATGEVDLGMHPVVVTHESATADANANENASFGSKSTGNATSSAAILRAHANKLATDDANVDAVVVSDENIAVSYREPAKLFGFITIHVPVKVTVDAGGNTNVSYPWYHFLMATDQTSIAVRAKAIADQHTSGEVNAKLSSDAAIRLVDALTAMLKSEASASVQASATAKTQ